MKRCVYYSTANAICSGKSIVSMLRTQFDLQLQYGVINHISLYSNNFFIGFPFDFIIIYYFKSVVKKTNFQLTIVSWNQNKISYALPTVPFLTAWYIKIIFTGINKSILH